ncbi:MAG: hypothetical protein Q4B12_05685 [Bowdeniella nasicola]|nr:hypothetical protein [Bowdeniella nasicola]
MTASTSPRSRTFAIVAAVVGILLAVGLAFVVWFLAGKGCANEDGNLTLKLENAPADVTEASTLVTLCGGTGCRAVPVDLTRTESGILTGVGTFEFESGIDYTAQITVHATAEGTAWAGQESASQMQDVTKDSCGATTITVDATDLTVIH